MSCIMSLISPKKSSMSNSWGGIVFGGVIYFQKINSFYFFFKERIRIFASWIVIPILFQWFRMIVPIYYHYTFLIILILNIWKYFFNCKICQQDSINSKWMSFSLVILWTYRTWYKKEVVLQLFKQQNYTMCDGTPIIFPYHSHSINH